MSFQFGSLRSYSTLLFIFVFLAGCSSKREPCEVVQARPLIVFHKVHSGDTLNSIAENYNMSVDSLCRLNGFGSSVILVPGQKIFINPQFGAFSQPAVTSKPVISVETNDSEFPKTSGDESSIDKDMDKNIELEDSRIKDITKEDYSIDEYNKVDKVEETSKPVSEFTWPVKGSIIRGFGSKLPNGSISEGINIAAPVGTLVRACCDGELMDCGELVQGFGNMVIISHKNGMISIYGHLQEIKRAKPRNGKIFLKKGDEIGKVGKTGNVKRSQLHFQLRNSNKAPVDPLKYLP